MKITCDITNVVLSGNIIDYVHKTKYLGVLLCSDIKTSIDACRQTSRFYAQANTLLRNFRYCSDDVKCMLLCSFCTNMYYSSLCFISTSSWINTLKTSYNGALRRLVLTKKTYSASTMFLTHGISSFLNCCANVFINFLGELVLSSNSIITACLAPTLFIHSPIRHWWYYLIINIFLTVIYLSIDCMYVFFIIMFILCIWTNVWNKELLLLLLLYYNNKYLLCTIIDT